MPQQGITRDRRSGSMASAGDCSQSQAAGLACRGAWSALGWLPAAGSVRCVV